MCGTCLCLISAFPRDRLQYLPLPGACAYLLIKQQELWLGVELLDWWYFISQLRSAEVFWFFPSDHRKSNSYLSEPGPCKRASAFYMPKHRYLEFLAKNNFCIKKLCIPTEVLWSHCSVRLLPSTVPVALAKMSQEKLSPARQGKGQHGSVSHKCLSSSTPLYLGLLNDHSHLFFFFLNLHSVTSGPDILHIHRNWSKEVLDLWAARVRTENPTLSTSIHHVKLEGGGHLRKQSGEFTCLSTATDCISSCNVPYINLHGSSLPACT